MSNVIEYDAVSWREHHPGGALGGEHNQIARRSNVLCFERIIKTEP